jgi:hypothetical protein
MTAANVDKGHFSSRKMTSEIMAGVAGLFGPDGPHPFGAALRAFTRSKTWFVLRRRATKNSTRLDELGGAAGAIGPGGPRPCGAGGIGAVSD